MLRKILNVFLRINKNKYILPKQDRRKIALLLFNMLDELTDDIKIKYKDDVKFYADSIYHPGL